MIAVREFTTTAEMQAHASAVHRRCFSPKVRAVVAMPAPIVPSQPKAQPVLIRVRPEWQRQDTYFDKHVVESRRILDLLKTGEIEFPKAERRTILMIVTEALQAFPGVTIERIKGPSRNRAICRARMEAIYAVRMERPDLSYPAIGRWFGGRDHTTILHSVRKIGSERASA